MKQLKTILEWLEQAKKEGYEWADAAIANEQDQSIAVNFEMADSYSDAIVMGFSWNQTPQGVDFWLSVATELQEKGK